VDIFTLREWDYTHAELVDNAPVEPLLENLDVAFWAGPRVDRPRVRDVRRARGAASARAYI